MTWLWRILSACLVVAFMFFCVTLDLLFCEFVNPEHRHCERIGYTQIWDKP